MRRHLFSSFLLSLHIRFPLPPFKKHSPKKTVKYNFDKMDARALRNPYHDYDGNPACAQAFFDSHGRVRSAWSIVVTCPFRCLWVLFLAFRSQRSLLSGWAARSASFWLSWRMGWGVLTQETLLFTPAGQVRTIVRLWWTSTKLDHSLVNRFENWGKKTNYDICVPNINN